MKMNTDNNHGWRELTSRAEDGFRGSPQRPSLCQNDAKDVVQKRSSISIVSISREG